MIDKFPKYDTIAMEYCMCAMKDRVIPNSRQREGNGGSPLVMADRS